MMYSTAMVMDRYGISLVQHIQAEVTRPDQTLGSGQETISGLHEIH